MSCLLHENIRKLRQKHGISQVEFAREMNVTKQCVSNWENDNVLPSIEMLIKIADFFKVSTDYLLGRESTKTLDCTGLTESQIAHLRLIATDLTSINNKK